MYYRGQRLIPTPHNPIRYDPHDFAVFEGLEPDGRLIITVVQKRHKIEPAMWWTDRIEPGQCNRRRIALYRDKVATGQILALLHEIAPSLTWAIAPLSESLNPYRFQGFFGSRSQELELDPDWVNQSEEIELKAELFDMVQVIIADLCQP